MLPWVSTGRAWGWDCTTRACKNVPYFDDILFLHVSQSNSWLFSLVLNGLTDGFHTASSNGLSVMLTSYILEIIKQGPFGRLLPRQGMYKLLPAFSSPPLCHIRCMIVNDVSQWGWVTVSPFHINSHRFKLIAHGLFSISGFPSYAHVPFNQGFPCSHISCLMDCSRTTGCFPTHGVSPSRLHFMLWFFKWSLVLGTGMPFSVPWTCINGKQFSQGKEVAFDMVLFLSQALLFLASWLFSSPSQRIEMWT